MLHVRRYSKTLITFQKKLIIYPQHTLETAAVDVQLSAETEIFAFDSGEINDDCDTLKVTFDLKKGYR